MDKFLVRTPIDLQKKMNSTDTETPIMAGKERGENSENKTADSQSDDVDMDIDEEPETVQEELVETTRIRESIITNLVRRGNLCTTGL
nr:PREDICTED: uncharacterized protein LOC107399132 isoform X2 [Tribolium castaneum]|eukprot:XP_015840322.1 PREDICTED: uncharacterized protein LOC107399132 isoform X2 [Tribolium castaneum]